MFPMDFEEFLWALGDDSTIKLLADLYHAKLPLGQAANRELMRKFRLYLLIGGMPQAIEEYLASNNFERVDEIKRDIIQLYEDDFYKIDKSGKISALYDSIPGELNKHAKGYQISSVLPHDRKDSIKNKLSELIASKTTLPAYNISDPNVGMSSYYHHENFRLYASDVGLLVSLMFKDKKFTENIIYRILLSDKLPANLGIIYENFVAQSLAANGHKLYYHTFYDQTAKRNYEIDFLLSSGSKISPIEVKSSNYRSQNP